MKNDVTPQLHFGVTLFDGMEQGQGGDARACALLVQRAALQTDCTEALIVLGL